MIDDPLADGIPGSVPERWKEFPNAIRRTAWEIVDKRMEKMEDKIELFKQLMEAMRGDSLNAERSATLKDALPRAHSLIEEYLVATRRFGWMDMPLSGKEPYFDGTFPESEEDEDDDVEVKEEEESTVEENKEEEDTVLKKEIKEEIDDEEMPQATTSERKTVEEELTTRDYGRFFDAAAASTIYTTNFTASEKGSIKQAIKDMTFKGLSFREAAEKYSIPHQRLVALVTKVRTECRRLKDAEERGEGPSTSSRDDASSPTRPSDDASDEEKLAYVSMKVESIVAVSTLHPRAKGLLKRAVLLVLWDGLSMAMASSHVGIAASTMFPYVSKARAQLVGLVKPPAPVKPKNVSGLRAEWPPKDDERKGRKRKGVDEEKEEEEREEKEATVDEITYVVNEVLEQVFEEERRAKLFVIMVNVLTGTKSPLEACTKWGVTLPSVASYLARARARLGGRLSKQVEDPPPPVLDCEMRPTYEKGIAVLNGHRLPQSMNEICRMMSNGELSHVKALPFVGTREELTKKIQGIVARFRYQPHQTMKVACAVMRRLVDHEHVQNLAARYDVPYHTVEGYAKVARLVIDVNNLTIIEEDGTRRVIAPLERYEIVKRRRRTREELMRDNNEKERVGEENTADVFILDSDDGEMEEISTIEDIEEEESPYVGDLHEDTTESVLFDRFSSAGPVLSIRVCRDAITRRSLGYGYINFQQPADAERALDTLNYDVINGKPCRLMWSQRDPAIRRSAQGNIYIKNLDKVVDSRSLFDTFSLFGGILSCKVATDDQGVSKGFGFVNFETQEAADQAVEKVNGMLLAGKKVFVGKFQPRNARLKEMGETTKRFFNVYIKNLEEDVDKEKLEKMFSEFGKVTSCAVMSDANGKPKGFGFVAFEEPEQAEKAVNEMHEKQLDGSEKKLFVCRAQKKSERQAELKRKFDNQKAERMQKYQGVNLYVKNLDETVEEPKLREVFEKYGTITSCKVMCDENGRSKGFGFVCFEKPEEATKAVTEMNGNMTFTKPLYVALAQRKDDRRAQLASLYMTRLANMRMTNNIPTTMYTPGNGGYFVNSAMASNRGGFMPSGVPNRMGGPGRQFATGGGFANMGQQYMGGQGMGGRGRGPSGPGNGGQRGYAPAGAGVGRGGMVQQMRPPVSGPPAGITNVRMPMNTRGPAPPGGPKPQPTMYNQYAAAASAPVQQAPRPTQTGIIEQKQMLGERIYSQIGRIYGDRSDVGKITGMMLEMDNSELIMMLQDPDLFRSKVEEAAQVLKSSVPKAN
uniref:Pab-1 n=1 Tax=Pristionchus pacificus TaxID=54126 RepID=A0A2A6B4K7_PRIPA|eukprot:PDM60807.1 pab-1 [Pristionchus pacificus]